MAGNIISTYNYNGDKTLASIGITGTNTNHTTYAYSYNDPYKRVTGITETNPQAVLLKLLLTHPYGQVAAEENQTPFNVTD